MTKQLLLMFGLGTGFGIGLGIAINDATTKSISTIPVPIVKVTFTADRVYGNGTNDVLSVDTTFEGTKP